MRLFRATRTLSLRVNQRWYCGTSEVPVEFKNGITQTNSFARLIISYILSWRQFCQPGKKRQKSTKIYLQLRLCKVLGPTFFSANNSLSHEWVADALCKVRKDEMVVKVSALERLFGEMRDRMKKTEGGHEIGQLLRFDQVSPPGSDADQFKRSRRTRAWSGHSGPFRQFRQSTFFARSSRLQAIKARLKLERLGTKLGGFRHRFNNRTIELEKWNFRICICENGPMPNNDHAGLLHQAMHNEMQRMISRILDRILHHILHHILHRRLHRTLLCKEHRILDCIPQCIFALHRASVA